MADHGLQARSLSVTYPSRRNGPPVHAVAEIDLAVAPGEIVGLVGESGCGKSSLARAIVGLEASTGELLLDGVALPARRRSEHARAIQMIFQDPYASLNPRLTVRTTLEEMLRVHHLRPKAQIAARARELVDLVGLPPRALDARPAALSGGQRQRVAIARALALEPRVLIADEPTTALDVSVQAVILDLFARLRDELDLSVLLITHNLGLVSALCDRVAVMYLGRIIEQAPTSALLPDPRHPYTRRLLAAVPTLGDADRTPRPPLKGDPPNAAAVPPGCAFHPRCAEQTPHCAAVRPDLTLAPGAEQGTLRLGHQAACHYAWQPPPALIAETDSAAAGGEPAADGGS